MIVSLALIFSCLLLPSEAYALPTPDVLVSLVNIVPLLTGTIVTVAGGAYYGVNRFLGPEAGKLLLGGLLGLVILLLSVGYVWNENKRAERASQIAMYLRCDISSHNYTVEKAQAKDNRAKSMWREYGNFHKITMDQVSSMLRQQPDAALVATDNRVIRHYSGIPTVRVDGKLYPFTHIRAMELPRALAAAKGKDLYLTDFSFINRVPSFYKADKSIFKKFDNVYIVRDIGDHNRFVYDNGSLRPADSKNKVIDWPVEKERWILDEKAVYFPGIANLLTDNEIADFLEEDDVYILAPYGSYRRNGITQNGVYLKKLLQGIDKKRVLGIDMTHAYTSQKLLKITKILDGSRFIVVGLTKHDWLYEGLDATFGIGRRLGFDPERFRLIGFNTRLPEVIARKWEVNTRKSIFDVLRDPFWKTVQWIHDSLNLSAGAAIFFIAVMLRVVLFPVGFFEACSRMKRANIASALKADVKPLWAASSGTLMKHVKVSGGWEILGTFVVLLLILPAYNILSHLPESVQGAHFLWIDNLTNPDYALSVLVGCLILLKLRLGSSSTKVLPPLLITIAFILLLFTLPSSLTVYVSGVLTITLLQDLIAFRLVKKTLNRALLV